jgi:hypothetical protein
MRSEATRWKLLGAAGAAVGFGMPTTQAASLAQTNGSAPKSTNSAIHVAEISGRASACRIPTSATVVSRREVRVSEARDSGRAPSRGHAEGEEPHHDQLIQHEDRA